MSLWLLCLLISNMNINMDSNKRVHKQTNMYGHLKRVLKPFNLTERSPTSVASFLVLGGQDPQPPNVPTEKK